ncbi:MAG: AAA family ATPase, partial [Proteobacteria bacterium]|nr:AAA family ATPase [Pseudomonadota bacterium]
MTEKSKASSVSKRRASARRAKGEAGANAVYFTSLTVENIRCFGPPQRLDLADEKGHPAQWTVLLGDNGVGKTTLLQCFVGLEPSISSLGQGRRDEPMIVGRAFLRTPDIFSGYLRFHSVGDARITAEFCSGRKIRQNRGKLRVSELSVQTLKTPADTSATFTGSRDILDLTCYAYGAARSMGAGTLADSDDDSRTLSLFDEDAELRNAEAWLLRTDYAASKKSAIQAEAKTRAKLIKSVLIDLLPDVDDIRFPTPKDVDAGPRVEFHTPYGWVPIRQLGLGYKTLIAWMVDFASRLFERYPESPNPLAEPAVCLVDEIDLHLHPKWQRTIMQYLSERFPNTQFIVTAHSPLIVQAATEANIAILRREGDHVVIDQSFKAIRGWRIDQVLTSDLFGLETARPPELDEVLRERKKLLTKGRMTAADKKKLTAIEAQIGSLPTGETVEDIEAMDIIRRAARRLK